MIQLLHRTGSVRRPHIRAQLALLYSGLVIALCAAALAAAGLLLQPDQPRNHIGGTPRAKHPSACTSNTKLNQ